MMNLMNQISATLIQICSSAVIDTAYFDGIGISFSDAGIAQYRLIEQSRRNFFELWILIGNDGEFLRYEGELSVEAQAVANQLFDTAWLKESEVDEEEVYQEDRFGVPCKVLRYEMKSSVQNTNVTSTVYAVDPSVPF